MLKFIRENLLNSGKNQIILVLLVTALVFLNSLSNRLVWDDHLFLENWEAITSYDNVGEILRGSAPPSQDKVFRPVRGLIWLVDYQTFQAKPFFYHFQALLIHLGVTLSVFLIAQKLFGNFGKSSGITTLPFLTALLFGVHPIHTETINYISASVETFGSLFFFISFYLYLLFSQLPKKTKNYKREFSLGGTVVFAALAFFTYEMTLTLPLLILFYELLNSNFKFSLKNFGSRIYPFSAIVIAALVYLYIRFVVMGIGSRTEYLAYSFYHTMLTMVKVFFRYIFLLLFPINQSAIHNLVGEFPSSMIPYDKLDPILNQTVFDAPVLLSIAGMGILIAAAIKLRKEFPLISFGIGWFFISLLPVSYIIPHGGAMAEKYLYIASFGFLIGTASVGSLAYGHLKSRFKHADQWVLGGIIVILAGFSYLTISRNAVWKDDISLFTDVVRKYPNNLMANYTLGIWYGKYNYFDESARYYQRAIDKAPEFWEARYNLGNLFIRQSKFEEAKKEYSQIVNIYPDHIPAKNILGNIDLIKEGTPSVTPSGEVMVSFNKNTDFQFNFPLSWSMEQLARRTIISDPGRVFSVEIEDKELIPDGGLSDKKEIRDSFLNSEVESTTSGKLVNQGLAQIPNVEQANVKVYQLDGKTRLVFYLFEAEKVVKISAFPVDLFYKEVFDLILGSVRFKK